MRSPAWLAALALFGADTAAPTGLEQAARWDAFAPPRDAAPADRAFSGRLTTGGSPAADLHVLRDDFGLLSGAATSFTLPPFAVHFAGDGRVLVPARRLPMATDGHAFDLILMPGRSWQAPAEAADRALIPFALLERNANCLHYGLMSLRYATGDTALRGDWQIASETCQYLKFDARGPVEAEFQTYVGGDDTAVLAGYAAERRARLPRRAITGLAAVHAGVDPSLFGSAAEVDPQHMTAYGFVIDGVHWAGGCQTRAGRYPVCEELPLPSYSVAKSLVAGLGLMRAERLFPGAARASVAALVPACRRSGDWQSVSIEHAVDMATGHFDDPVYPVDEDALLASEFFTAGDHATKIDFACNRWPGREPPGRRFVYHTTDTYIAGTALAALLRRERGRDVDLYDELIVAPLWEPLGLSPLSRFTRRSSDLQRQPFSGWGLTLLADDIARIARFLGAQQGRIGDAAVLDESLYEAAMQRRPADRGLPTGIDGLRYNNGFWAYDAGPSLGCEGPAWVPLMSGYGGIIVTLFPNDTAYYYVSDGGTHRWLDAARAAHGIRPMCAPAASGMTQ